jgi:hypothetical protein
MHRVPLFHGGLLKWANLWGVGVSVRLTLELPSDCTVHPEVVKEYVPSRRQRQAIEEEFERFKSELDDKK